MEAFAAKVSFDVRMVLSAVSYTRFLSLLKVDLPEISSFIAICALTSVYGYAKCYASFSASL